MWWLGLWLGWEMLILVGYGLVLVGGGYGLGEGMGRVCGETLEIGESVVHATPPRSLTCTGDSPILSASYGGGGRGGLAVRGTGGRPRNSLRRRGGDPWSWREGGDPLSLGHPSPPPPPPPKGGGRAAPPPKGGVGPEGPYANWQFDTGSAPVPPFAQPHISANGTKWFPFSRAM